AARRRRRGAGRRELVAKSLDDELVAALRVVDVLQPLLAEVAEADAGRQLVAHQGGGGGREEHLAAVCGMGDPRALVQAQAVIALVADLGLTGVETHPHAALGALRPVVLRQRALCLDCRGDGVASAREGVEEGVALRVHLAASVLGEGDAQQATVVGEQVAVLLPELLQQAGRALDVGEEHRDRAGGERRRHRTHSWASSVPSAGLYW